MSKQYVHARTCVYNINYHIVWCVKYRRKVLSGVIVDRLYEILDMVGKEKGFTVVQAKVEEEDHIHCFISAPPTISVTAIVKYLKGISGRLLLKEYPELRKFLFRGELWSGSYFAETIGSTSEGNIRRYIEGQKTKQI